MSNSKTISIVLSAIIIAILSGMGVWIFISLETDAVTSSIREDPLFRAFFFLYNEDDLRTGMLLLFNTRTGRLAFYEVPNNLGAFIPASSEIDRLDVLFRADNLTPYLEEMKNIVATQTNFYLAIPSTAALSKILDLLGGFWAPIDNVSTYVDGENLPFLLEEGLLPYHIFVQLLIEEFSVKKELLSHKDLQRVFYRQFHTNLDFRSFRSLMTLLEKVRTDSMYYRIVEGAQREVIAEGEKKLLLFPYFDGEWVQKTVSQLEESLLHEEEILPAIVTLEILNGTEVTGLAGRARDIFREFGFDILSIGNAQEGNVEHTVILNHTGNLALAQRVADVIEAERIRNDVEKQVDVTVILGKDFDGRYVR